MAATYRTSAAGGGTSGTGNRTATIVPASGDLIVVFVSATGNTSSGSWTMSDDNASTPATYTRVTNGLLNASADSFAVFVRDSKINNTTSTIITATTGSNTAGELVAVAVSGMTKVSAAAIRQSAKQENQASGGTPAPAFAASALTGNITLGMVANGTNPATMTPPTSWLERQDVGQTNPAMGVEVVTRDSGFTGTTITWGGTSASAFGSAIVELDGNSDVTAALSGTAATSSAGTAAVGIAAALSGQGATASAGALVNTPTVVLAGQAATTSAGTLAQSVSVALSGTALGASAGTLAPGQPLLGTAATASTGALAPESATALSGIAVASSAGTVAATPTAVLAGQAVAVSAGTITASSGVTAALTGQAATASAGTPGIGIDNSLTGSAAVSSAGTLVQSTSAALSGTAAASSAGTAAPGISKALSGTAVTSSAGAIVATPTVVPTGQAATASAGTLALGISKALAGQAVAASAGTLSVAGVPVTVGLTGQSAAASAGTLTAAVTPYQQASTGPTPRQARRFRQNAEHTLTNSHRLSVAVNAKVTTRGLAQYRVQGVQMVARASYPKAVGTDSSATVRVTSSGRSVTKVGHFWGGNSVTASVRSSSRMSLGKLHPVGIENPSDKELIELAMKLLRRERLGSNDLTFQMLTGK